MFSQYKAILRNLLLADVASLVSFLYFFLIFGNLVKFGVSILRNYPQKSCAMQIQGIALSDISSRVLIYRLNPNVKGTKLAYANIKRSVLRRQSRDTNRNIKRSVYCQYG